MSSAVAVLVYTATSNIGVMQFLCVISSIWHSQLAFILDIQANVQNMIFVFSQDNAEHLVERQKILFATCTSSSVKFFPSFPNILIELLVFVCF